MLLTGLQKKTLLAAIEEGGRQMLSSEVTRAIGANPSSVQKALPKLTESNILREKAAGERTATVSRLRSSPLDQARGKRRRVTFK